jgi:tRNA threonylcarbamoyl adenosine modification protein (Sua5/YciO/YrdC/YwlC family)
VSDDALAEATRWVREGHLLAYPTETVWGLGADARSQVALDRLRRWKGRGDEAPVSILVDDSERLESLGFAPSPATRLLAGRFWPGPLTLVMRCASEFARGVARSDGAVGVRCSSHPIAAALARSVADAGLGPLTSTSLNRSGDPPARDRDEARALCGDDEDAPRLLDVPGVDASGEAPSTVVDVTGPRPRVIRWGALPAPLLDPILKECTAA